MERTESEWLRILDEEISLMRANYSHSRIALVAILGGLTSSIWSILEVANRQEITRHEIAFIAPFFLCMTWFSTAVAALASIYYRKSLTRIEEAMRDKAAHGLTDPGDLLSGAIAAMGLGASVISLLLLWDSALNVTLQLLFSVFIVFNGLSSGLYMIELFSQKELMEISLAYMGFPKKRRKKSTKGTPSPSQWTSRNTRYATAGLVYGTLMLIIAWQIKPSLDYLLLGALIFVALYLGKSSYVQYGHMVENDRAVDELSLFRRWIITTQPSSGEILEKYKALYGLGKMVKTKQLDEK